MSRICVKNLPKYVGEEKLRDFFSQKGEITDAKLMRTIDGKSRQFAFIGFRNEHEAEEAIKYFNKSYLDTSRIICEIAHKVGDPNIPRPWSRHTLKKQDEDTKNEEKGVKLNTVTVKGEKKSKKNSSEEDDPQLQEFLQIMQPRVKSKMWANDTLVAPTAETNTKTNTKVAEKETVGKGVRKGVGKGEDREKVAPVHVDSNKNTTVLDSINTEKKNSAPEVLSEVDYFKSRVKKDWSDSESDGDNDDAEDDEEDGEEDDEENDSSVGDDDKEEITDRESQDVSPEVDHVTRAKDAVEAEVLDQGNNPSSTPKLEKEEVFETNRLFVRNLPYTATEDELQEFFGRYGNVSQVHVVVDKDTKRSKGFAYILYALPEAAKRALEELDNSIFQGRLLHVMPSKVKPSSDKQETDGFGAQNSKTFKQKREDERKASEAGGDTKAWNSLFMRPDTVVENIARKYGVSKSDLLDREADDLAVRLALGETQVVSDTKKALTKAGVNVTSLEEFVSGKFDGTNRSKHVLLVKNLPYGSSESELAKMFGKFGSLDKLILPPTRTIALVVFLEPAEARAAFKGLAYKRYKDAPLYLEWAPGNILSQNLNSENDEKDDSAIGQREAKRMIMEQQVEGVSDADVDPDRIESRSLFVKNLNFKTTDEILKKHFSGQVKDGKVRSVRVKKHLKNGKNVSMGFGFIEFDSVETATSVCRDLQGTILDGHALILQLCHAKKDDQVVKKAGKDKSSTKLLVRNVAFEATEKDLRQLFSPFGQIKSLRLPMKFGTHRGFAFVEYVTKQEAHNALQALSSTHLYGRHLVLERAKEGESLEELRARTAAQFTDESNGFQNPTRLSKKRKLDTVFDEGTMKFERFDD